MDNQRNARPRPSRFKIDIPGDDEKRTELLQKMQNVRQQLTTAFGRPVNNGVILNTVLDFWIKDHDPNVQNISVPASYSEVKKSDTTQDLFVTTSSSLKTLLDIAQYHARLCSNELKIIKTVRRGHVVIATVKCTKSDNAHTYKWSSSPYLPNKEYLVNHRVFHGFVCSGMLPIHYTRFSNAAGLGCIDKKKRRTMTTVHNDSITTEFDSSINTALLEEVASYEELDGIDIITDARHGWRKNAKDSSIVAIGEKSHKVMNCVHITKTDDAVSQRHEKIGTEKLYTYFDSKDVSINVHTHDRNMTINKFVKTRGYTVNQNDSWHGVKTVKKAMKTVSSGAKYKEGKTWSEQLVDKVEPVATHFHWAIRNCEKDPQMLRSQLSNVVSHYKNGHSRCHATSRCQRDPNYEPSRQVITNPKAEKMLECVINNSAIFKSPDDFVLARDTSYVESFNNVMNIFQDKRISFTDQQYNARSQLAVLHWNENVDRGFTSIYNPRDQRAPRRKIGKKNYKALSYKYRQNIWKSYIESIFDRGGRRHRRH